VIWYSEKQRFTQWWLWLLMIGINGVFLYGLIQQVIFKTPFGNSPMSNPGLISMALFIVGLTFLFFLSRLETQLSDAGLSYRFFPFRRKFTLILWDDIESAVVREYSPMKEFGGWGLRYSLTGKGKAISIAGNAGLQLVIKGNQGLLIGTQNPTELNRILSNHIAK